MNAAAETVAADLAEGQSAKLVIDNWETGELTFKFDTGATLTVNTHQLSPEMMKRGNHHGWKQKIQDSYAGAKKAVEDGHAESRGQYAFECASEVIDNALNNIWSTKREAGGPRISLLAQAVARALNITVDVAVAKLATMSDEQKRGVAKVKAVALAMIELRKEAEARREAKLRFFP